MASLLDTLDLDSAVVSCGTSLMSKIMTGAQKVGSRFSHGTFLWKLPAYLSAVPDPLGTGVPSI